MWLDRVGWVGLGLGILALILLFINKYYINPPPKRTKKR
ncbi:MAG: threonine synthase [Firmicutes bacterium]|nr:threonine synthase [Bacillota bacterium]